jgi:hypothetical protein
MYYLDSRRLVVLVRGNAIVSYMAFVGCNVQVVETVGGIYIRLTFQGGKRCGGR